MSRKSYQPVTLVDTYSLGFRFPWPGHQGLLLRNRTIVAVCWDGEDAQFVNAAGLAVPCRPGDLLRRQLSRASHREFGVVIGDGQFAMKPHVLKSMESAGTLRKWVLYRFSLCDCWFYDDATAWAAHEQADIAELSPKYFLEMAEVERQLQRRQRLAGEMNDGAWGLPSLPAPAVLEERRQKAIAERLAELREQRRQALEQDRQLGAWLRGELAAPPLLRGAMNTAAIPH